jgi:hypothetical protein
MESFAGADFTYPISMRVGQFFIISVVALGTISALAKEVCVTHYSELDQTDLLKTLKPMFRPDGINGFVNETKGSYLVLKVVEDKLGVIFYTSGLFNLTAIKREGPLTLCDEGDTIKMVGLDRSDKLKAEDGLLILADGGPRKKFMVGEMPSDLVRMHHIDIRTLSSSP